MLKDSGSINALLPSGINRVLLLAAEYGCLGIKKITEKSLIRSGMTADGANYAGNCWNPHCSVTVAHRVCYCTSALRSSMNCSPLLSLS